MIVLLIVMALIVALLWVSRPSGPAAKKTTGGLNDQYVADDLTTAKARPGGLQAIQRAHEAVKAEKEQK